MRIKLGQIEPNDHATPYKKWNKFGENFPNETPDRRFDESCDHKEIHRINFRAPRETIRIAD